MTRRLPLILYGDGLDVWRWGLQFRIRPLRGLGIGVEWHPGPFQDSPATHSRVELRLGVVVVVVEHARTWVRPVHRIEMPAGRGREL